LEEQGIHVDAAILFGSFAKGTAREESDIDVALISEAFSGDRFDDRRRIVPLRRAIDSRLEPMPFRPEGFAGGGNLVDEIKRDGIRIEL
jgi:predicted nucleotidyltransferase